MIKRVLIAVIFVALVFVVGIFLENKIKNDISKIEFNLPPTPSLTRRGEIAMVKRVVDGDTIELDDGRMVRYIGIDSLEMTDSREDSVCIAKMSRDENQKLVEGKKVELEKDISDIDKYGRLLRYVWIDGKMVNQLLVSSGHAKVATYPPDVKYKDLFINASKLAAKLICNKI